MSHSDDPIKRDHAFAVIGERIRQVREHRGWTRKQLAEASKLRVNAVTDAEMGVAISVMTLLQITDALDSTLDTIVPLEALE